MRSQVDSYSMLICSKYVNSISDMINITLINSKFKENIDKFHFNPFQINEKSRKYFSNLQTQWLFDENETKIFTGGDISGYYVHFEIDYYDYLKITKKNNKVKFRRIIYTENDRNRYGDEIPDVVNKLDDRLFQCSIMKEIKIPDSIVEIGNDCFKDCQSLTSITISSRLTNIGKGVFSNCYQLSSITLPSVLTSLNDHLFCGCSNLTRIEYSPFVVDLNDNLFYGNGFSAITIPTSITRIGYSCFSHCKLTSLTIPSNVIEFGKYVFGQIYGDIYGSGYSYRYKCEYGFISEIKEVEIPNNMMELPEGIFRGCHNLTKINLPSSLTKIGICCFYGCIKLQKIHIPMRVIEIGGAAFRDCSELKTITGNTKICKKNQESFINTPLKGFNKKK